MMERLSEDEAWELVAEAALTFNAQAAKELAFELGLVGRLPSVDEPVPSRTIH